MLIQFESVFILGALKLIEVTELLTMVSDMNKNGTGKFIWIGIMRQSIDGNSSLRSARSSFEWTYVKRPLVIQIRNL